MRPPMVLDRVVIVIGLLLLAYAVSEALTGFQVVHFFVVMVLSLILSFLVVSTLIKHRRGPAP